MLSEAQKQECQEKREAWAEVERLTRQAWQILNKVNESPTTQAQLMQIEDRANVQQTLWLEPKDTWKR